MFIRKNEIKNQNKELVGMNKKNYFQNLKIFSIMYKLHFINKESFKDAVTCPVCGPCYFVYKYFLLTYRPCLRSI